MLTISCVMYVASAAALLITLVLQVIPSLRRMTRRAAIALAMVCLASAAVFQIATPPKHDGLRLATSLSQ